MYAARSANGNSLFCFIDSFIYSAIRGDRNPGRIGRVIRRSEWLKNLVKSKASLFSRLIPSEHSLNTCGTKLGDSLWPSMVVETRLRYSRSEPRHVRVKFLHRRTVYMKPENTPTPKLLNRLRSLHLGVLPRRANPERRSQHRDRPERQYFIAQPNGRLRTSKRLPLVFGTTSRSSFRGSLLLSTVS
jgi:hypothetical protein